MVYWMMEERKEKQQRHDEGRDESTFNSLHSPVYLFVSLPTSYRQTTYAIEVQMDGLQLPIDSRTLESSISSRKLRAVDADGTLLYEES